MSTYNCKPSSMSKANLEMWSASTFFCLGTCSINQFSTLRKSWVMYLIIVEIDSFNNASLITPITFMLSIYTNILSCFLPCTNATPSRIQHNSTSNIKHFPNLRLNLTMQLPLWSLKTPPATAHPVIILTTLSVFKRPFYFHYPLPQYLPYRTSTFTGQNKLFGPTIRTFDNLLHTPRQTLEET